MEQLSPPVASSPPPFFCGSPPSRVANPLIQDARFGDENFSPLSPSSWVVVPALSSGLPPSPSSRKGGCVRSNFGNNPAVRIEGFDCLDRDRRNCSIPALAQNKNNTQHNTLSLRLEFSLPHKYNSNRRALISSTGKEFWISIVRRGKDKILSCALFVNMLNQLISQYM